MKYSHSSSRRKRQPALSPIPLHMGPEHASASEGASQAPKSSAPAQAAAVSWSFAQMPVQRQAASTDSAAPSTAEHAPPQENRTGLPKQLKAGIEGLSGQSLDDVRVHYNSSQPAQLHALAYTQGTEIHMGPGQEKHLGHEAWHVVQQKQGRVKPTLQMKGVAINDDVGLEQEADIMGKKALGAQQAVQRQMGSASENVLQLLHGATPQNFRITSNAINNENCTITTGIDWDSSTGDRNDLRDIVSREQIIFNQDPRINVPGYGHLLATNPQFQLTGNTVLTKEMGHMAGPGGSDEHSGAAYGSSFTINGQQNLQQGNWTLTGTQYYQYLSRPDGAWVDMHHHPFTITRTMQLVNNDHYELTIQKQGPGVNVTAGPTRINFETARAIRTVGPTRDQTPEWNGPGGIQNIFTQEGLIIANLATDQRIINGTPVTFEYNYTRPNIPQAASLNILHDQRDRFLARARSAVSIIVKQALTGSNSLPTRFVITLYNTTRVRQQALRTTEMGGTYRLFMRVGRLEDRRERIYDTYRTISGRESQHGRFESDKQKRFAEGSIIHELGHMLHAFKNLDAYHAATFMPGANIPAGDPLRPEKMHIAAINQQVILALVGMRYKGKWAYGLVSNPAEVLAEVFTALMYGRNVPPGLAALYIAYGGIRSGRINAGLQKSFPNGIPTINRIEDVIPMIR